MGTATLLLLALVVATATTSASCGTSSTTAGADAGTGAGPGDTPTFGGARPLDVFRVPAGYDKTKPAPLVLVLHGYSASGNFQNLYFRLGDIADEEGFFIAAPDGTIDSMQKRFWNAIPECCDFEKSGVDDLHYLTGLIAEIRAAYAIDPKRIYVLGHSNGGAMAYRLACDASEQIAAIVSLAGPFFANSTTCAPTTPVAVQHMHGTADDIVPFDGGPVAKVHPNAKATVPSAMAMVTAWAGYDKCATPAIDDAALDIDGNVPGAETKVTRFSGCASGSEVILWTMQGSPHVPGNLVADAPRRIYAFMKAHPKADPKADPKP